MDEEEISGEELSALVARFEQNCLVDSFDYYSADHLSDLIEHYIEKPNYKTALRVAQLAIEQHPYDASFFSKKAYIYTLTNKPSDALNIIDVALDLEPGNSDFLSQKASILELLDRPMEALELFDQALENGADEQECLLLKMFVYFNMGNHALAINMIEQIFSKPVEDDRLILECQFCLQLMDVHEEGIRIFKAYLDEDPYHEVVWLAIARLYMVSGFHDLAVEALDFALAIDDEFSEAYFDKGQCLFDQGKFEEAVKVYQEYINIEGADAFVNCNLGDCYMALNQLAMSRTYYKQALKIEPKFAHAWYGLGQILVRQENYEEAYVLLKKAAKLLPDDEQIIIEYVSTMIELAKFEEAANLLEDRIEKQNSNEWAYLMLASIYHATGLTSLALEVLIDGVKKIETPANLFYKLAAYYFLTDFYEEGIDALTEALLLSPADYERLFVDAPHLKNNKHILDIIELYKNED
ncbi:MAG: tetratricopeptide repeat protein [Flavobacteriales bacterium]|nr:tetratricopeptide repeat protein [Flavobacteriales bacterium]